MNVHAPEMLRGSDLIISGELVLYGFVGDDLDGFTDRMVREALALMSGDITVRLNSAGGYAYAGMAIFGALVSHKGHVTVKIDGVAASAASLIAMAGDTIICPPNATIMIHNASAITAGTKEDHAKSGESLAKLDGQAAAIYAERSGQPLSRIEQMMNDEVWMTGIEAVALGFASSTGDENMNAAVNLPAFDYTIYQNVPGPLMALAREQGVVRTRNVETATEEIQMPETQTAPRPGDDKGKDKKKGPKFSAGDQRRIKRARMASGLEDETLDELEAKATSFENFSTMLLDAMADADAANDIDHKHHTDMSVARDHHGRPRVVGGADRRDKFREGATLGLMARVGSVGGERNEFTNMSMTDLARESLEMNGTSTRGMSTSRVWDLTLGPRMAGGMHSTSDFPIITGDAVNKSVRNGYEVSYPAMLQAGRMRMANDFKTMHHVVLGNSAALDEVAEGGEYTGTTLAEGAEAYSMATYGKLFNITRQALINDDAGAFTAIIQNMVRGSVTTVAGVIAALFAANSGAGPTMNDGNPLFHADHNNLAGSGAAPSVTTLDAGRASMRRQTGLASEVLGIGPRFLIVPPELETAAEQLVASLSPSTVSEVNPFAQRLEVIADARLTDTAEWYLAADPDAMDGLSYAYLNGESGPEVFVREGWEVDGQEFKVRLDFGAGFIEHRGWYKNPGS